jgi:hypothetical protein
VRRHGAVPVFLALDNVVAPPARPPRVLAQAAASGMVVFDLLALWQGRDPEALRIAPWDNHPNRAGNRLVAEELARLVRLHAAALRLEMRAALR